MKQQPRQTLYKNLTCAACNQVTNDWYMLRGEVWQSIIKPGERYLCLACVVERLGRELTKADFTDIPVNQERKETMEKIYTIPEVAQYLKLSKSKVYYLIARREIPHIRIGRNIRITESDLVQWLEANKQTTIKPKG